MKKPFRKISLVLFFSIILLNAFGYTSRKGIKNNSVNFNTDSTTKTDTAKTTAPVNPYNGKVYIFDQSLRVTECRTAVGDPLKTPSHPVTVKGSRFTVVNVMKNGDLVILFWIWDIKGGQDPAPIDKKDLVAKTALTPKQQIAAYKQKDLLIKRKIFNFDSLAEEAYAPATIDSTNDNRKFFILTKDNFDKNCSEYQSVPKWDINFGTLSTPFKLRFNKFSFTNNLSVGGAVFIQRKFSTNWSNGVVIGLSLSSVTLDAASTNVYPDGTTASTKATSSTSPLATSTTRPAFTPSIHYMVTYKNISFLIGGGFDFISKTTDIATTTNPEAGWIYNGKPWIGIGFGISLFNNSSTPAATPAADGQTKSPK